MWMTSCPEAMGWGFWVIFEKKQLVEIWSWTKRVDFWAGRGHSSYGLRDARALLGQMGVSLSLLVLKNLNLKKVIKVSYLN